MQTVFQIWFLMGFRSNFDNLPLLLLLLLRVYFYRRLSVRERPP